VQEAYHAVGAARDLTRQLYDVRLVLEISAAGWAAERANDTHVVELEALVAEMRSIASESRNPAAFLRVDRKFHDVIGRVSANMVLRGIMRDLHNYVIARWTTSQITVAQLDIMVDQHTAIAAAIRAHDPTAARTATEVHLRWAKSIETER
jgi:DNA-binding FadR family transcriptional regulator